MLVRIYDLKQKEVICAKECKRLGFISDVCIDLCTGKIIEIIVPKCQGLFKFWGSDDEYHIPWNHIIQIGDDVILVNIDR